MKRQNALVVRLDGVKLVAAYVRVSTDEQAQHRTSIDSQIATIRDWCDQNSVRLVDVYSEPGLSGTDEGRPQFNLMMNRATSADRPYDIVVVHSLSRFARDLALQTASYRRLHMAGVEMVSVTEQFGKGSSGNLMRAVVGAYNEHLSAETSKHVRRTMRANAAEGFWNGGKVPFGFCSITVEMRGQKAKKKLAIDEEAAAVVRLMYDLALSGSGGGPMGVRAIAAWLNERGYRLNGGKFHNSNVADILARTNNIGYYQDGKVGELGEPLPEQDWIRVPCPRIVDDETFLAAAAMRAARRPRATPPRVINGVTLLPSRIARCDEPGCGAGLTVRTGKGGRYHYYTCEHRANRSRDACTLPAIRRSVLDDIVLDAVLKRVLDPEHLEQLLAGLLERSEDADQRRRRQLASARTARTEAQKAVGNLLRLVESGTMPADAPEMVERIAFQRARQHSAAVEIESLERQLSVSRKRITPEMIAEFGLALRTRLMEGDPNFRRAYIGMIVERVGVSEQTIRISGSRAAIEQLLVSNTPPIPGGVPNFNRDWCGREDSNFHGLSATTTSTLRVYQFRHDRTCHASGRPAGR